jgi:hypothetical protein
MVVTVDPGVRSVRAHAQVMVQRHAAEDLDCDGEGQGDRRGRLPRPRMLPYAAHAVIFGTEG